MKQRGVRRLYVWPRRDVARMEFVCGFQLGRDYACRVRLDSRYRVSGHVPVIRRSIWCVLLYCPGAAKGHMYISELFYLCLYGEVVPTGVRLELPLCPGHVVVDQPHFALLVWPRVPRHRIEVAICISGNSLLGAQGRIPRLPGH